MTQHKRLAKYASRSDLHGGVLLHVHQSTQCNAVFHGVETHVPDAVVFLALETGLIRVHTSNELNQQ